MTEEQVWKAKVRPELAERSEELVGLRREFHRRPELSFQERWTAARIREWLSANGIEDVRAVTETGVSALIRGGKPGPTLMYRADIDGLPIQEDSGVESPSEIDGVMHACGHDSHIAIALMVAAMANARRETLAGNVKVVFQPAEEVAGGALPMIEAGIMEDPHVDAVLGLHITSTYPAGQLGVAAGATMAGAGQFNIRVLGKGGHGAAPHNTVDPIVTGAQIVSALQTIVSRGIDPMKAAVVTVGIFNSGIKVNIIPDFADIGGTFRAFDAKLLAEMPGRIEALARGVALAAGADLEFEGKLWCPAVDNDSDFTARVKRHAVDLVGVEGIFERRITGSDDMAYFLEKTPGCYFFLGGAEASKPIQQHHQARFRIDESVLPLGSELALRVIDDFLS